MKKFISPYHSALFALSLITCSAIAKQHWSGSNVHNVKNEDLVIGGDIELPKGATFIQAVDRDVTVYLEHHTKIKGHDSSASQLHLQANKGYKIRFIGDHDFDFIGSRLGDDLLVLQSGCGSVEFAVGENKRVMFTAKNHSGGVRYYLLMQEETVCMPHCDYEDEYCMQHEGGWFDEQQTDPYIMPHLLFEPLKRKKSREGNSSIVIGKKSLLSYLSLHAIPQVFDCSQTYFDAGRIEFDPSNKGKGLMVLTIEDGGAFVVAGSLSTQHHVHAITLDDIKSSVAAGHRAIWTIVNSQGAHATAGLVVENENTKLFELLADPFGLHNARSAAHQYRGDFNGKRYGVVIGANGMLQLHTNSYLDYVGLSLNQTPAIKRIPGFDDINPASLIKQRNASALFIDGNNNPNATAAKIKMDEKSALIFRSGVGENGKVRGIDKHNPFTVDIFNMTPGIGNIVFDVEGALNITGSRTAGEIRTKIEILSLEVDPTGGSLFVGSPETNFPKRTFEREDGEFLRYNKGAFLINNAVTLNHTTLSHTDDSHHIYQENDIRSEATYVGGETFKLEHSFCRPSMRFINSSLRLNTSAAFTGMDLVVPNYVTEDGLDQSNISEFIFYANAPVIDNGTGRQLVMGTQVGAFAADNCGYINGDAHLDIVQCEQGVEGASVRGLDDIQMLVLTTANNDISMNPNNATAVRSVIQTIFLGNSSNISVGVNADASLVKTNPTLLIDGNVFSFTSKGGPIGEPETSNITGKGGVFVDLNGTLSISPAYRASFGLMVTRSHNGIVNLPTEQAFFENRVGIADWKIDLRDPNDRVIVAADQIISDYTFNWIVTKKDFANFVPYDINDLNMCSCPTVTAENIASLPVVQGQVNQFQIQGTRIGDPAQILVDGGFIREIVFLNNNLSAEAPVAIITVQNEAIVGLGSSDVSPDSLFATTTLGSNGIMIIANGSARIELNQDLLINGTCAFVKGPDFQEGDILEINTTVPREIRITSGGVLDLRSFGAETDLIQLIGSMNMFVEPGATIILGGGTLSFAQNSQLVFESLPNVSSFFDAIPLGAVDNTLPITIVDAAQPHNELSSLTSYGQDLLNTNMFRARLIGVGTLELTDNAQAFLPVNTFLGIETLKTSMLCEIPMTDIEIALRGNADFIMGRLNNNEGGVLQVGNVQDNGPFHSVNFTLTIDGSDAEFFIGSYGYLGLGVGIERYDGLNALGLRVPNEFLVNNLFNVNSITLNFLDGEFTHDRIFSGDLPEASLMAISNASNASYNLIFTETEENPLANFILAGGGNIALVNSGTGGIAPIIRDQVGVITDRLTVGILASTMLLADQGNQLNFTGLEFFNALSTNDALNDVTITNAQGRANAALADENIGVTPSEIMIGAVIDGDIVRFTTQEVLGIGTQDSIMERAVAIGAVAVNIDQQTGQVVEVSTF